MQRDELEHFEAVRKPGPTGRCQAGSALPWTGGRKPPAHLPGRQTHRSSTHHPGTFLKILGERSQVSVFRRTPTTEPAAKAPPSRRQKFVPAAAVL